MKPFASLSLGLLTCLGSSLWAVMDATVVVNVVISIVGVASGTYMALNGGIRMVADAESKRLKGVINNLTLEVDRQAIEIKDLRKRGVVLEVKIASLEAQLHSEKEAADGQGA